RSPADLPRRAGPGAPGRARRSPARPRDAGTAALPARRRQRPPGACRPEPHLRGRRPPTVRDRDPHGAHRRVRGRDVGPGASGPVGDPADRAVPGARRVRSCCRRRGGRTAACLRRGGRGRPRGAVRGAWRGVATGAAAEPDRRDSTHTAWDHGTIRVVRWFDGPAPQRTIRCSRRSNPSCPRSTMPSASPTTCSSRRRSGRRPAPQPESLIIGAATALGTTVESDPRPRPAVAPGDGSAPPIDEAWMLAAIEHAADSVVVRDRDGIVRYVNRSFEQHTGRPRDELIGQRLRIFDRDSQVVSDRQMRAAIRRGQTWTGEVADGRPDGSIARAIATVAPIRDRTGAVVGTVAVKRDISRERALEERLVEYNRERTALAEALQGVVVHDSPEATAAAICRTLVRLPNLAAVGVLSFREDGSVSQLALVDEHGAARPAEGP